MRKNKCNLELSEICGTNIDTEGICFSDKEPNLVYIDKVFSFNRASSCPLVFHLNTAYDSDDFIITIDTRDCERSCECEPCIIDKDSVFNIENTYAEIDYIETNPPGNISTSQVLLDGETVDSVRFENGRYIVGASSIIPKIQNKRCDYEGLPTKVFFLLRNICNWEFRATIVIEGTVNTRGRTCCFRAKIRNNENEPPITVPSGCCSNFAIPDLAIPCPVNGNSPEITFRFGGKIKLVNPELKVKCNRRRPKQDGCAEFFMPDSEECSLTLKTKVAIEPTVHVQVVRKTLFIIDAREGIMPCGQREDSSEFCGTSSKDPCNNIPGVGFRDFELCDKCRRERDDELSLRELCDLFCNDRKKRHDCNGDRRRERDHKRDRFDDDCRRDRNHKRGHFDDDCWDDRVDRRHDDCFRCDEDFRDDCDIDLDLFGCDHHRRNSNKKSRTAFNLNGCNGCTW